MYCSVAVARGVKAFCISNIIYIKAAKYAVFGIDSFSILNCMFTIKYSIFRNPSLIDFYFQSHSLCTSFTFTLLSHKHSKPNLFFYQLIWLKFLFYCITKKKHTQLQQFVVLYQNVFPFFMLSDSRIVYEANERSKLSLPLPPLSYSYLEVCHSIYLFCLESGSLWNPFD